jgi:hypothetical protein
MFLVFNPPVNPENFQMKNDYNDYCGEKVNRISRNKLYLFLCNNKPTREEAGDGASFSASFTLRRLVRDLKVNLPSSALLSHRTTS